MHLSSVFPAEPLRAKFSQSILIEQWDKSQLAKIATLKKESIFEIGAGVGIAMLHQMKTAILKLFLNTSKSKTLGSILQWKDKSDPKF